jgi:hypothetical protein
VPTRKQRRRREKSFRHEYEYVLVDDEGNEVAAEDAPEAQETSRKAPATKAKGATPRRAKGATGSRTGRVVQPASWRRVAKRGAIFAPIMFIAVSVLDKQLGAAAHAVQTLFLLAVFLPFSYVMDSVAYRMYVKRSGGPPAEATGRDGRESKRQPPTRSPR